MSSESCGDVGEVVDEDVDVCVGSFEREPKTVSRHGGFARSGRSSRGGMASTVLTDRFPAGTVGGMKNDGC